MSRGQETQVFNTAQQQNQQFNQNAQNSYTQAQEGVTDYEKQLSQFAAANPYGQGGEFQTSQNQVLANTSDAAAQAAAQQMQGEAVRTGQNSGSAIAATQADEQANERNLSSQQGNANATRIGDQATYNKDILSASSLPATLETTLSGQQADAGNKSLEDEQKAGEQPSFLDSLGTAFATGLGGTAGKAAGAGLTALAVGCWIAARLWNGWNDDRTVMMRLWLSFEFSKTKRGAWLTRFYARHGEFIADKLMPRSTALTWALGKVFAAALKRAAAWASDGAGLQCGVEFYKLHDQYIAHRAGMIWTERQAQDWAITAMSQRWPARSAVANAACTQGVA